MNTSQTSNETEDDMRAELRHLEREIHKVARYHSCYEMPKSYEECVKYNNRIMILIARKQKIERQLERN
jgi:hypothetical protein